MKKVFFSTISLLALGATSALSADLPSIKSAPAVALIPMWTGFYAGLNSGYNFGTNNNSYTTGYGPNGLTALEQFNKYLSYPLTGVGLAQTGTSSVAQSGFIAGGQVGYNYQLAQKFIVGIETDIQGAGISGSGGFTGAGVNTATVAGRNYNYSADSFGQTSVSSSVNWLGTVRGRLGYLVTPTILAYGTGGLTYGGVKAGVSSNVFTSYIGSYDFRYPFEGSQTYIGNSIASQTLIGWNAGGGFEWMFSPNWSLKSEAIYWNMGNVNLNTTSAAGPNGSWLYRVSGQQTGVIPGRVSNSSTSINYQGVIARAGINYHFDNGSVFKPNLSSYITSTESNNSVEARLPQWSSFYAGLNSGYNFGANNNSYTTGYGPVGLTAVDDTKTLSYPLTGVGLAQTGTSSVAQSGFIAGGQVGYNYQLAQKFIVGIETDIQGAGISGSGGFTGAGVNTATVTGTNYSADSFGQTSVSSSVNWLGTVRGRLGYLVTPTILAYGTGGLTYGGVKSAVSSNVYTSYMGSMVANVPFEGSQTYIGNSIASQTLIGWNAGGGFEWMFSPNWSLKSEAIYWNMGNVNLTTATIAGDGGSWEYKVAGQQYGVLPARVSNSNTSINFQGVIARAGINYHFDFGRSAPVVPKF